MKKNYLLFFIALYCNAARAQTVVVSGQCMTATIVLTPTDSVNDQPAYQGTGTVDGNEGVAVTVFWLPAPDNVWVLAFDGQPYFQNSCATVLPPSTGNAACEWTTVEGQTCTGAAPLVISGMGTLAVSVTSFAANPVNKQVIVTWKTLNEINNRGFDIQRSREGTNWNSIGFVNGAANPSAATSYRFIDPQPLKGKNFYRLRQVDFDGKYIFSKITSVSFLQSSFYSLFGTGNNIYRLNIDATNEKVELTILNAAGKKVMTRLTGAGTQIMDLNKFPLGIYLLRIRKGTDLATEKLVKL